MKGECGKCTWFMFAGHPLEQEQKIGYCRRYPPTVFRMETRKGSKGIESHFPIVQKVMFCGEFSPKELLAIGSSNVVPSIKESEIG